MVAAPIEITPCTENSPWSPPYTVDTLFELPEADVRFEVLGGSLVVVPPPTPEHNYGLAQLLRRFSDLLPPDVKVLPDTAVRLPNGDGPIPDLLVTSAAKLSDYRKGLPADLVHTIVEVVSPSNAFMDRRTKTELYAEAGIPCYWRGEERPRQEEAGGGPAAAGGRGAAQRRGGVQRLGDERDDRVEHRGVLGESLGGHGRAADDLAGHRVDHHGRGDEPAVAEDPPLGEQRLAHVAHRETVDVHVPALHMTDQPRP